MSIINRRNAILGWAVWNGSKRFATFKAKRAAKPSGNGGRSKKKPLLAFSVAGLVGALTFWRKHQRSATQA
jgi:hypothetical protein